MIRMVTAVLTFIFSGTALAAPFGDTATGASNTYSPCTADIIVASLNVGVDASSRLLVSIGGSTVSADNAYVYALSYQTVMRTTSGTDIAKSQSHTVVATEYLVAMSDSEVLYNDALSAVATVLPGNYVLELHVETSGSCSGSGVYIQAPTLTYLLLSSVADRIFANGFSMLSTPLQNDAMV